MRRISGTFSVALLMLIVLLTSCSNNGVKKVGYLHPSKSKMRFVEEGKYMLERLTQLGYETTTMTAENDDALQLEKGYEMLDQGVDLLVIVPVNGNTIAPLVREANARGVHVIAYNRLISNVDYDMFFTGNNFDNGRIFCEGALEAKPTGNYIILAGDRFDKNGVGLKLAIDSLLKPHIETGNINVVYESYIEGWNKDNAKFELEQAIQSFGTNIDAVIACSDPMAAGAIEVLEKYNLAGKVFVTGQDALLPAVKNIYAGKQSLTIYHPHKKLGYEAAMLVDKILKGESKNDLANAQTFNGLTQIPTLQVNSVKITKDNIEKELIETGEYTWDEIRN